MLNPRQSTQGTSTGSRPRLSVSNVIAPSRWERVLNLVESCNADLKKVEENALLEGQEAALIQEELETRLRASQALQFQSQKPDVRLDPAQTRPSERIIGCAMDEANFPSQVNLSSSQNMDFGLRVLMMQDGHTTCEETEKNFVPCDDTWTCSAPAPVQSAHTEAALDNLQVSSVQFHPEIPLTETRPVDKLAEKQLSEDLDKKASVALVALIRDNTVLECNLRDYDAALDIVLSEIRNLRDQETTFQPICRRVGELQSLLYREQKVRENLLCENEVLEMQTAHLREAVEIAIGSLTESHQSDLNALIRGLHNENEVLRSWLVRAHLEASEQDGDKHIERF